MKIYKLLFLFDFDVLSCQKGCIVQNHSFNCFEIPLKKFKVHFLSITWINLADFCTCACIGLNCYWCIAIHIVLSVYLQYTVLLEREIIVNSETVFAHRIQ